MVQDSIWHRRQGPFRQFLNDLDDKMLTVKEALSTFREQDYTPKDLKNMKIQDLLSNPKRIEELFYALRRKLPESKFRLPYKKVEREQELIHLLAEDYNIDKGRAQSKIVSGKYNDGTIAFNYCLEAAMAPFREADISSAGDIKIIGNINSGMHIDGGSSFFSNGHFVWYDKKGNTLTSDSVRGILHECGFNTNIRMSRRRFYSVLYLNLLTPVPDWTGGAGKTHIELAPYADVIAKTVSGLAYKMPSYHGQGFAAKPIYSTPGKDPTQEAKNYLLIFLKDRREAVQGDPSIKTNRRVTQQGVWYLIEPEMKKYDFQPPTSWAVTRKTLVNSIPKAIKELWPDENITREDLGIIAGARAVMHFDGNEYPVSTDNIVTLAQTKTTDMIVIEKEGIADALFGFADEHKVALVFTRGRFVNYVKELIKEASARGITNIKIWVLTDYDVDGEEIAKEASNVPRIGVDRTTVRWLQQNGYPKLKMKDVEEEHHSARAASRTKDSYLWDHRIEIDAILARVGHEGLWKYLMHQVTTMEPIRDYTPIIEQPEIEDIYPEDISTALENVNEFTNGFVKDKWKKIEKRLKKVKGKLLKPSEEDENNKQKLMDIVETHSKEIIEKFIEEFNAISDSIENENGKENESNGNQFNQGRPTN